MAGKTQREEEKQTLINAIRNIDIETIKLYKDQNKWKVALGESDKWFPLENVTHSKETKYKGGARKEEFFLHFKGYTTNYGKDELKDLEIQVQKNTGKGK